MKKCRVVAIRNYEGEKHEVFKNTRKDAGAKPVPKWLENNSVSNNREEFENLFNDKPNNKSKNSIKKLPSDWEVYKEKIKSKMSKKEWANNKTTIYNEWLIGKQAA
jgi:hypothetical protein